MENRTPTTTINGITYDACECCGKPKKGTGRKYSHAIFVVKGFVRKGKYVDFPDQWRQLCEAVGFVTLHWHNASLVEQGNVQPNLLGEKERDHTVSRKSFFRRLAEKNGSPEINAEVVLCMRKP